jgi:limonene-1,2-epoxide hydrolase
MTDDIRSDNIKIVEDFIHAWSEIDLDKIMEFFADDCLYHNIPMEPLQGTEDIRKFIEGFIGMSSEIVWDVHHICETAKGAVLTERTDKFKMGERWVALPVMGTFELKDGKLIAWRDYFDVGQFQSQMSGQG